MPIEGSSGKSAHLKNMRKIEIAQKLTIFSIYALNFWTLSTHFCQTTHWHSLVRKKDKELDEWFISQVLFRKINNAALLNFDMNKNGVLFRYWPHQNQWTPPWCSQLNAKYAASGVTFSISIVHKCSILQDHCQKMFSLAKDQAVKDSAEKHQKHGTPMQWGLRQRGQK